MVYVFQQYTRSLFPWKTVERNVAFGLEHKGTLSRDEIAARTREMIGLVRLTGFERHYPWQLSGGMVSVWSNAWIESEPDCATQASLAASASA